MAAENAFQILCATRKKIHINQNIMIASTLVEPKLKIEIILLIVFFEEKKYVQHLIIKEKRLILT